ncbi:MAG: hypothetical protein V1740_00015 [Candidatus Woesearchaeota archaeon]
MTEMGDNMKSRKIILTLIMSMVVVLSYSAMAVPSDPEWFWGTVTAGGDVVTEGAIITATIGGEERGTIVVSPSGTYGDRGGDKLTVTGCVSGDTCYSESQTITFTLTSNDCSTSNTLTDTFNAGIITNLNLAFSGSCGGGASGGPTGGGTGGSGGSGGGGGGAAAEETEVSDSSVVSSLKKTIPSDWTNVKYVVIGSTQTSTSSSTPSQIDLANSFATQTQSQAAITALKEGIMTGKITPVSVKRSLDAYRAKNLDLGTSLYRSIITLVAETPTDIETGVLIEVIPPDMATSLDELTFLGVQPTILQDGSDGGAIIVQWDLGKMSAGSQKTFQYVVHKRLSVLNSVSVAGGSKLAPIEETTTTTTTTQPVEEVVKPKIGFGIILFLGIIVLGLIAYFAYIKLQKR